jgi:hypothetical protein
MNKRICPILVVLLLATCSATAQEYVGDVPSRYLKVVRMLHKGMLSFGYPDAKRDMLRLLILSITKTAIKEYRAFMVKEGWDPELLREFGQADAWGSELRAEPRRAHELWKFYRQKGTREPFSSLAHMLLVVAVHEGFLDARFDLAHSELQRYGTDYYLTLLANEDHLSAQLELVKRYEDGDGLEKDYAKAFYWVFRALLKGADVSEQHRRLGKALSEDELGRVASWSISSTLPGHDKNLIDFLLSTRTPPP